MADVPHPNLLLAVKFVRCTSAPGDDMFNIVLLDKDGKLFIISTSAAVAAETANMIKAQLGLDAEHTITMPPLPERIVAEALPMPTDQGQMVALMAKGDRGTNLFGALTPDEARNLAANLSASATPPNRIN